MWCRISVAVGIVLTTAKGFTQAQPWKELLRLQTLSSRQSQKPFWKKSCSAKDREWHKHIEQQIVKEWRQVLDICNSSHRPVPLCQVQWHWNGLRNTDWATSNFPHQALWILIWLKHHNYFSYPIFISRIVLPKDFPNYAFMSLSWLWSWHLSDAHQNTDRK